MPAKNAQNMQFPKLPAIRSCGTILQTLIFSIATTALADLKCLARPSAGERGSHAAVLRISWSLHRFFELGCTRLWRQGYAAAAPRRGDARWRAGRRGHRKLLAGRTRRTVRSGRDRDQWIVPA